MEVIKTDIFVNRRSSKVMFFGVVFSLVLSLILGVESVFAHTTTLSTSGTVRVNVSTAADSAAMGTDNVVVNSTCPLGYTLSIGGPSDNTLYKGGNSNNTAINTTTGTVSTPKALVGEGNLGTWGYSVASGTTATSSNFIGLTNATAVLTTKGSASAVGGDMVPVYYGVSIDNSIEPGLYKMSNNSAVTYYLTAEANCSIYKIQYNDNGANSATTMSITHNNVAENDEITLYASNYQRSGYGFAGWSTTQLNPDAATFQTDLATAISNGEVYGPNETITANANFLNKAVISNNEQVINLYAIWVKPETNANLQNWTGCSTMSNGDIVALKDTRDNQVYAVAKLADGNCWMIENLRLDTAGSSDASKAQEYGGSFSSLANPETADFSNSTTANSLYYSGTQSGTATVNIGTGSNPGYRMPRYSNVNSAVSDMTTADQGVYSYGNYYNWAAAKANTSALTNVSSSNAAKTSLCPSGWKLPVGTQTAENGGFGALSVALGGPAGGAIADDNSTPTGTILSKNFRKYPNNFVYAGYYTGSGSTTMGSNAHYWSATASTTTAYRFTLSTDSVNPATSAAYKYGGRPIRCIASLGYTITYDANGGTGSVASQTLTNSDSATLELASNGFARDGYYFKGWATSANGAVAFRANETVTTQQIHNDTTLYAVWGVSADTALYDAVESLTKGTLASKSLTLKTEITKGNSGVYTYDASTSGTASDASTSNPIYFYRGILDNTLGTYGSDGDAANYSNYVKLSNNTCWRIFRTTGSGGVKMIYNGTWDTTNNTCARTGQDTWAGNVKYGRAGSSGQSADWQYNIHKAGYTYNKAMNDIEATTAVNTVFGSSSNPLLNNTRSNIKIFLEDTWYAGNMTNYTGLLEASAGYCNDRTLFASSTSVTEIVPYATSGTNSFGAYRRNQVTSGNGSSLECSRGAVDVYRYVKNSDTGWTSNELKYPTALITMDEAALSGSGSSTASHVTTYNSNSFLNPGAMFWTMSPRSRATVSSTYATYMEVIANNGASNASAIHAGGASGSQRGARPVISLQSGVKIGGGSGTATNPWTISSYGVSFEANGGGGTMTDQVIQRGVATALSSSTFTAPTNRTFKGWNTAADGSGTSYANGASVTNIANSGESITLYAQWGCPAGQVCYNDNGANSATTMGNESVGSSDTEVILWASNFKRSGYGFAGWNTAADGSGTNYGPNETISDSTVVNNIKSNGLELYAIWKAPAKDSSNNDLTFQTSHVLFTTLSDGTTLYSKANGYVTALKDARDNQVYAIAKLADGNYWMIENLRLDYDANITTANTQSNNGAFGGVFSGLAEPETANFTNSTTANSLYKSDGSGDIKGVNGATLSDIGTTNRPGYRFPRYRNDNTNTDSTINANVNVSNMTGTEQNVYSYGNYYTWAAAVADTSYYNVNNQSVTTISLCPTGWRLPQGGMAYASGNTSGVNVTGSPSTFRDFYNLGYILMGSSTTAYEDTPNSGYSYYSSNTTNANGDTATKAFRKYPNNFLYSGRVYTSSVNNRGSVGSYWSSTAGGINYNYGLYLDSSNVRPGTNNYDKYYGNSIRCMITTNYGITLDQNGATTNGSTSTTVNYGDTTLGTITNPQREYTISGFTQPAGNSADGATVSSTSTLTSTYTFKGWYRESGAANKIASNATTPVLQANTAYTDANGKWTQDGAVTLYAGWTSQSKTLPTITKSGYSCGWTETATGATAIQYESGSSLTPASDKTLYGVCVCPEGDICYDDNGANSSTKMDLQAVSSSATEVTLWASNFQRANYGFAGWNTAADGSGTDYGPNETITNTTTLNTIKNGGLRLYAKWVASAGNIQGWIGCPAMSQGDVTALKDTRDNQVYAVAKLADGNCWMIENLRLNASNSSDSSKAQGFGGVFAGLADSETSNLSNTTTANSLYYSGTQDGTASINIGTGSTPAARIPRYNSSNTTATVGSMSDADQNVYSYGNYYNWAATKANTASLANATNSNNAKTSLCPAGWMLPLGTQTTSDKSFGALSAALGGPADGSTADDTTNPTGTVVSNNFRKYPNNFVYAGYMSGSSITSRGSNTNHWTGTSSAAGSAYRLTLLAASVNPATNTTTKYGGRPMRCIMITDYTISYDANGGTGSVDAQTLTLGGTLELASNGFSRDGYYFKGWATSASGAVAFRPNEIVDASQIHNDTTLYAVWGTSVGTTLYNAVSSLTKGTLASKSVSLSDAINKSNSGVYTYDSGTYGTASDSSTSKSIYFYRGVLDNNVGTYGSDGDAANYPNYIKLDNNTCWRIIRTTGSGGVKIIYNGVWDSTNNTCANATTNAQVATKAFGRKGGSTASSTNWRYNVSRVGYTYNSAVDDSTTSTSVDTVFGNSSDLTLNDSNSNMKNYLENTWYPNNMGSYTSLFEANAGYCNDRSAFSNASATPTALSNVVPYATTSALVYFGPRERNIVTGGSPSLNCSRGAVDIYRYVSSSSTGYTANELRFPTALATMDEISFAITGKSAVSNANSFLNTGSAFLTLSPNRRTDAGITYMQIVSSAGNFADSGVNTTTNGVRPVVSIKSGTQIGGGSGTATNPWTLNLAGYIYYDANGADGNTTMDRQSVDSSATSATLWASNFKRSGYGFAGWNTAADGSGTNYGPNEDITDTATLSTIQSSGLRLYAKWVASAGNLQCWTGCSSLAQGAVTALTDTRDNDTYAVAKLADGNCWMIENLRLDYNASHNSDGTLAQGYGGSFAGLAQPETGNFSNVTTANSLYYSGTQSGTASIDIGTNDYPGYRFPRYRNDNTNSDSTINPNTTVANMTNTSQKVYSYGNYYSWAAAIADTNFYGSGQSATTTSLCPSGWHLPTGTGSGEFGLLSNSLGGYKDGNNVAQAMNSSTTPTAAEMSRTLRSYPNNFLYSGSTDGSSFFSRGSGGDYWSSTASGHNVSYHLFLDSTLVYPGTNYCGKFGGISIRCLAGS